jgi:hypothetical protein
MATKGTAQAKEMLRSVSLDSLHLGFDTEIAKSFSHQFLTEGALLGLQRTLFDLKARPAALDMCSQTSSRFLQEASDHGL